MPIGNLTSQETANLYLHALDIFVKHVLRVHFYARYMDDFILIVKGKKNAQALFSKITEFCGAELLLDMSEKCSIQKASEPLEFVGYIVTPHGLRLRKKTTKHIKHSLIRLLDEYHFGCLPREKLDESITCYIGMCKHCSGRNLVEWINKNITENIEEEAA